VREAERFRDFGAVVAGELHLAFFLAPFFMLIVNWLLLAWDLKQGRIPLNSL